MTRKVVRISTVLAALTLAGTLPLVAATAGIYRGVAPVVRFDISPPLRSLAPLPVREGAGLLMVDPDDDLAGPLGPQDADGALVQDWIAPLLIPAPLASFDGPGNDFGVAPPDPNGDVGPNHVVVMSNLKFAVYTKAGALLYGPAANNTLWTGFGGPCQSENAGDPIVLYDQFTDRWMLSQFTAAGPTFYNCVALTTSSDPTGPWYRWAFTTGTNFPDYPKYGFWGDALYISTREFAGGSSYTGVGAYAVNKAQIVAGNPSPTVISFFVTRSPAYNVGDGLLPADVDGFVDPPAGDPEIFVGSMDNGASYGAPQDALTVWRFHADFATPANSTFTLAATVPIASYDTIFPCGSGRQCIPQPGTANKIDILSYRQRPLHRAAYRNFGDHESIVTNQSVEGVANMAGIRWWELRDPNGTPTLFQEGTYVPGASDSIHRWMGSIAMDSAGNMALGYSASAAAGTFPSVWYTGRLAGDPAGTLPQGEGSLVNGTGSQTGSNRWGDYTSTTVDPIDDCTFWMVNQYVPTTSSVGWRLRVGAFKFDQCGTPDFYLGATPASQGICAGDDAVYTINVGSVAGFTNAVTLAASGNPGGTTTGFAPNPVTPPGTSAFTVGNTSGAAPGIYSIAINGTASGSSGHSTPVDLAVFAGNPTAPTLTSPANGATNVPVRPAFTWTAATGAEDYLLEVDNDPGFTSPLYSATVVGTTQTPNVDLPSNSQLYWRVTANNPCGATVSTTFSFTTVALPGDCATGTVPDVLYDYGFESGVGGWTHSGTGDTWALSTAAPHGGTTHFHANDPVTVSNQGLISPDVVLPTGENPIVLKFWHTPDLEPTSPGCYDGGILEVSTNGGSTWSQVLNASLLVGPYTGVVSNCCSNPLAGLQAWCGTSSYMNTIADISAYAGQTARFRLRLGSDSSVSHPGWNVDDVVVQSCQADTMPFLDGFETGDTSRWSIAVP
jgi:hypothetical protein